MPARVPRDRRIERALGRGEVALHYQPQIEPWSGRVVGVEALARWPEAGGAEMLFERARRVGLAARLSRQVQRRAIRAAAAWDGALAGLSLSVNVLPEEVAAAGYRDWLVGEVMAAGLAPERLTVEIVEHDGLGEAGAAIGQLEALREVGISIAIDDFGTGYSSLSYLNRLPIDAIKIDRGLIAEITRGERDRILAQRLVELARELGLKVVVEGVESTAQLALLVQWRCDLYQGFQGAGALDERALERFVANAAQAAKAAVAA